VIQDRYRVISRIGQGGTGVVYMVEHTLVGRRYALKVLDDVMSRKPVVVARFHREARAAAAIGDKHIVEVVDMGNLDAGAPYLVMELLEGRDLGDALKDGGPMPIVRALDIATQCCEALGEAHKKGIIHRDIKPENIFLTRERDGSEFVKILDFGISKILEAANDLDTGSLTRTGTAIGTPRYMSIEQVDGFSDVDARTDQYSMGVVLFEMLIGRAPFDAPSYGALVRKVASEPPPSLVDLRADVPPALEQVIHRALAKNRNERFASMEELAQALAPFAELGGAPKLTGPDVAFRRTLTPRVWERPVHDATSRFVSRKMLIASGLIGVALIGALAFAYVHFNGSREATAASALTRSASEGIGRPPGGPGTGGDINRGVAYPTAKRVEPRKYQPFTSPAGAREPRRRCQE
jgi:serine/threonine-protein kinase